MGEAGLLADGIVFMIVILAGVLFLAYIVNTYAQKQDIKNKIKREREYEESQKLYCPHCGRLNKKEFVYCQYCGLRLHSQ